MLSSRPRQRNKPSFDIKCVPNQRYNDTSDFFDDPTQKTFEIPNDAVLLKQSSAPTVKQLVKSSLNLSCSIPVQFSPHPQTPMTPSPKNLLLLNRRVMTKGYAKFVEDREFLSHREEERVKVQESVKKTFAKANPKIMSEEIQKLVSSAIVNTPIHKLNVLRKSAEVKNLNSKMPTLDERHKKICRRILGNEFESTELFLKEQEEAKVQMQQQLQRGKKQGEADKSSQFEHCWKKPVKRDYTDLVGESEPVTVKKKKAPRKVSALKSPFELTSVQLEKNEKEEIIDTLDTLEETVSTKVGLEDEGMTESVENSRIPSSCQVLSFGNVDSSINVSVINKRSTKNSIGGKSSLDVSKIKADTEAPTILIDSCDSTVKKLVRRGANSFAVKENRIPNTMKNQTRVLKKEDIDKINKMCKGAIKLTQKEGVKLKRRQLQVVKDYNKLDTKMERLTYDNTVENWEKSVKEVYKIEQTSPFYNLVVL